MRKTSTFQRITKQMNVTVEQVGIHFASMVDIDLNGNGVQRCHTCRDLLRKTAMEKCNVDAGSSNVLGNAIGALNEVAFNRSDLYVGIDIDLLRLGHSRWIEKPGGGPFSCEDS